MSEGFDISDMPEIQIFDKAHVLYGKPGPKGEPDYIGRTSGEASNDADIERIIRQRDRNHHMNDKGFGKAKEIFVSDDPAAIRGLEQLHIDKLGGAQSIGGSSSNAINSIGKNNPKREEYLQAAKKASEDA